MNAIQMAIKAAIENAMGNLPPEILNNIGQIGEFVKNVKTQLDRIENQQRLILAHMKIPGDVEFKNLGELPHARE